MRFGSSYSILFFLDPVTSALVQTLDLLLGCVRLDVLSDLGWVLLLSHDPSDELRHGLHVLLERTREIYGWVG